MKLNQVLNGKLFAAIFLFMVMYHVVGAQTGVQYQKGYIRKDGTAVQSHVKTGRNESNHDNYSTAGNTNTYTGTSGSTARDYSTAAQNYGSGKTIHTGSQGGQYYVNDKGNKVYVPKR